MQPTRKLIILSSIGILLVLVGAILNIHLAVFFIYNTILIGLVIVDLKVSIFDFEITRDEEIILSLYGEEEIGFQVYNKSDKELIIYIKDTINDLLFQKLSEDAFGIIKPHEQQLISYKTMAKKRGVYNFNNVYVKLLSNFELVYVHKHYEITTTVKVYPNLKDLSKYRLMVYDGHIIRGSKKVFNRRGEGLEYESLREYVSGDSYKKINWKATASRNKPIINQYDVERNQDIVMLIDSGKSMSFEVRGYKKLDLAINTALILSDIANISGDKSGLMVFNKEVQQYVKPSKGATHRNKLLEALYRIDYSRDIPNFYEAFKYLNTVHKKRSIIFLFTEFETMDEATEYLKVLPQVAKRHLVIMFMMVKEKVVELTKNNSVEDQDLFIKGAAFDILNERKKIIQQLRNQQVMCVECLPENLTLNVINYYITLKQNNMIN